jgi:hypothetical protein
MTYYAPKPVEVYRDFEIYTNPAWAREYRYWYQHKNWDGPEDGRCGNVKTVEEAKRCIDWDYYPDFDGSNDPDVLDRLEGVS